MGLCQTLRWQNRMGGILQLVGLGQEIWQGVNTEQYVRELRENWE